MRTIIFVLVLIFLTALATLLFLLARKSGYYEYAILNKTGEEQFVLRFPKSSVSKYPGWKYERQGPENVAVWYPSLQDRVSYNVWISSAQEQAAGETKPSEDDRKLSIGFGWGHVTNPDHTLDTSYRNAHCELKSAGRRYSEDGEMHGFNRYILEFPGSPRLHIKYHPVKPIRGVYCITCIENANCRLIGVTDSGIRYNAFYEETRMPEEAMDIHRAVGKYFESKRIK